MQKKIFLQISLFFLVLLIIFVTFNKYFRTTEENQSSNNSLNDNKKISDEKKSNVIKNIYYISTDNGDNVYEIMSDIGEIDLENPSIIFMKDVTAKITFANSEPVHITSKYAKYNNENYETTFSKNILVKYVDHKIRAEEMRLSMEENLATLSENIFYNYSDIELIADKVEIDLLTKDSKIFMDNNYKKVEITKKNKNGDY
ncbi:LPS export ABC transporter periplasmic protein LptC [Candidatus Pelagibacter bacterium]|nr:LPS export ABC transporter periplasmic protein LptC [Candidatus Pelagibacter bacterium]|tara:strand:+ start:941 stop:1543 length:603 start_codon:yes stop_codon:yes gene_type:complete